MLKTYLLTFYNPDVDLKNLSNFVRNSTYISEYWNYLPMVYCFTSPFPINELRVHFEHAIGMQNFIIVEINPMNVDGRLGSQDAWEWFAKKGQTQIPPPANPHQAAADLFGPILNPPSKRIT
ncbi:hypothetical protein [Rhizobium leguminosarum]|uniref:hypothetical protein n=1 Tax=Rhizobium leguminosarum TaxID=384 RepID=UPI0019D49882|nr:hypothetical protein [Rhizobium leguminosarum]